MRSINYVDLLLIAFIVVNVVRGWQRGFLLGVLGLAGWLSSLLLALRFAEPLAEWFGPHVGWSEIWDRPAAFVVITLGVGFLFTLLANVLLRRLPREIHTNNNNRLLGLIPGAVNGLIFAAIIATLLLSFPLPEQVRAHSRDSELADRLAAQTDRLRAALVPIFGEAIAEALPIVTIHPDTDEVVSLPFSVAAAAPRTDLEQTMLELVNRERAQQGLPPLDPDPQLAEVARRHSADMLARGYFGHYTPEGKSPFDRIAEAEISYLMAGENLAFAPTLKLAHTGLMNSPGHRANILHEGFGRAGIGILDAGPRGLMVTQLFRD